MARRVTQAAYARHRGVTKQAVHYALKVGRIHAGEDGLLDVAAADRAWRANTSPVNGGPRPGGGRKPRRPPAVQTSAVAAATAVRPARRPRRPAAELPVSPAQASLEEPAGSPPESAAGGAFQPGQGLISAKTTREEWAGKLAELSYRERAGELLERDEVHRLLVGVAREIRDALYGIPPRLANVLAAETVPAQVHALLEQEITKSLDGLARAFERVAPAEAAS